MIYILDIDFQTEKSRLIVVLGTQYIHFLNEDLYMVLAKASYTGFQIEQFRLPVATDGHHLELENFFIIC